MAKVRFFSAEKFFNAMIEEIEKSNDKYKILQYVGETMDNCSKLCGGGENIRALNELKFMICNIRKQIDI